MKLFINSLKVNALACSSTFVRASTSCSLALGSVKLAVPTCTAEAPMDRYSSTSSTVSMPPNPRIAVLTALFVSQTSFKVMGLIARPNQPDRVLRGEAKDVGACGRIEFSQYRECFGYEGADAAILEAGGIEHPRSSREEPGGGGPVDGFAGKALGGEASEAVQVNKVG